MRLRARAPGKVNLGLRLGPVREDGRHQLATVFQSVSLADELCLEPGAAGDEVICPGVPGVNLAARALAELRARGWSAPPVRITIRKRVPVAAGMGGGSADAAAALRLAAAFDPVASDVLAEVAAGLGADVPAQLEPGAWLGTGAGERIDRLVPPAAHAYVIVPAGVALATPAVFAQADRLGLPRPAEALAPWVAAVRAALGAGEGRLPASLLVNDLEPAAVALAPEVAENLERIRRVGADHALVCGSGPTAAGLFWGPEAGARAAVAAERLGPPAIVAEPVDAAFAVSSPV
jgi:4-diphosphocytidyl-2-C-methyl-D-erythritol kinase